MICPLHACVVAGSFPNLPPLKPLVPDWAVGERCLSCKFRDEVQELGLSIAADWEAGLAPTDQCHHCDY